MWMNFNINEKVMNVLNRPEIMNISNKNHKLTKNIQKK